jgi:hypothetical protein
MTTFVLVSYCTPPYRNQRTSLMYLVQMFNDDLCCSLQLYSPLETNVTPCYIFFKCLMTTFILVSYCTVYTPQETNVTPCYIFVKCLMTTFILVSYCTPPRRPT